MTQLFIIFWSTFFGFGNATPTTTDIQQYNGNIENHQYQDVNESNWFKDDSSSDGNGHDQKGG